jgi:hypothetical protein
VPVPAADSPYQDSSQDQEADCLPEIQRRPAKESRYQPVPKTHHHNAGHADHRSDADDDQDCFRKSM